ncbi:hypothetical protein MU580_10490 [Clavibacter michiganensis subsp. michiganensis]|uniref:BsuBI/PstI family type II restriction endonuclease n=2 Tax=Clavibacter michiganensis TaxID=28447 RepID=UPI001FF63E9C|nr:BsuBI/PstI family type II restriction endonuclease [Clavibacter michiganensis]UOW02704.1 hypothetical protein MU580_10490 [Clavibacter michiganensis subsp. michiganensis]
MLEATCWAEAKNPRLDDRESHDWICAQLCFPIAENTRETDRRQALRQFWYAGLTILKETHSSLIRLFGGSSAGLVYVSCFPYHAMTRQLVVDLALEAQAWCAMDPPHNIHLKGDVLMGPHEVRAS